MGYAIGGCSAKVTPLACLNVKFYVLNLRVHY